ncbi:MAG: LPS assembly protein LptD [Gammaproteobacteria bacterium]|nr:LPS assembly protein LptD [Gammaproteobacteria bacterium]
MQPPLLSRLVAGSLLLLCLCAHAALAQDRTGNQDRWPLCPGDFGIPPRPAFDTSLDPEEVEINADDADITEGGIADFWGDVVVTGRDQAARADHMRYYQSQERGELEGNVELWDADLYMTSDSGEMELDEDHGTFYNANYWLPVNRGRGEADSIYHNEREQISRGEVIDYTTCPTSSEIWKISASKLTLDHEEEWGSARNVVLRIRDVPVFYTPYASFPLSDKRKSGFLPPSFGTGSRTGAELITPYYWNIAPQMDATISPRFMADRGIMLMGEYRYLFEDGHGEIDGEFLPSDGGSNLGNRSIFGIQHYQEFANNRGSVDIDFAEASDRFYLEDFGTSLDVSSTRFLRQRALTRYSGSWWHASANVQSFDIVDSNVTTEPFKRLPQLRFGTRFLPENWSPHFQLESEAVYFTRDEIGTAVNDVKGARYDLMPSVSYPMRQLGGYIEPKVGIRFTQYDLHGDDIGPGQSFDDDPSRTLPFASVDSGLFFERDFSLGGRDYQQTLEPRLFYLYVPDEDQSDLPVFDTNFYDISFAQLFRENRFSGADRFGDANQVTLAVTSRILDLQRGRELGRFSIGQTYFFDDRDVTLPGFRRETDDVSPIVAELATTIIPDWEAAATIHWDPNDSRTEKLATRISYNDGEGRVLNLAYRMRRDRRDELRVTPRSNNRVNLLSVEQTDVSFSWPLTREWSVVGRWNYALPESKTLEIFGGVQYDSCCWAIRAVARRFINATTLVTNNRIGADDEFSTGIFLQFEMKGLTGLGRGTGDFLKRSIRGYDPDQF